MTVWRLIDSGNCDADYNMALDEAISTHVREGKSEITLRLYGWRKPSVTLGFFQNSQEVDLLYCKDNGIPVVRRPTGGRGILHSDELTYSFSTPTEGVFSGGLFDTYHQLGIVFKSAFKATGIDVKMNLDRRSQQTIKTPLCFKSNSYGELTFNGKKIIGSAQKRWRKGFLQQGCIPFSVNYQLIKKVFKIHDDSLASISGIMNLADDFNPVIFKTNIIKAFEETFNLAFVNSQPSSEEVDLAQRLVLEGYQCLRC